MNHIIANTASAALCTAAICLCSCRQENEYSWLKTGIDTAVEQTLAAAERCADGDKTPCTVKTKYSLKDYDWQMGRPAAESYDPEDVSGWGEFRPCIPSDWRSGFFSGSLWYLAEITGNENCREQAVVYTNRLAPIRTITNTHDLGFMAMCSYGNALRVAPADSIDAVLADIAENLASRFDETIGCIKSWDGQRWNYPVIIDNMMNLNLLFKASEITSDAKYRDIAVKHACTTMANHFRENYSTYHVVSYNDDGTIQEKCTHQGLNDDSSWSRGQAWGLYGYSESYRNSGEQAFLDQAVKIAEYIMSRNNTEDLVPIWDFDAPQDERTPRDASAGAIIASALLDLCTHVEDGSVYFDYAEKILKSLSSPAYLAEVGTNDNFVLMHSTTSLPARSEVDAPLNYADYYYIEAVKRYMDIKGLSYKDLR